MTAQRRTEIAELLTRHGLRPDKRLGQHFLADPNIVGKIVRLAEVAPGDRVLEIGAGTGTLTMALADAGASVVAYEVDSSLGPLLREVLAGRDVTLRIADATRSDIAEDVTGGRWKLVANLPYNIGTPLLLDMLRDLTAVESFTVMLQREVADRLTAEPGSRTYGLPSVVARLYGTVRFGFAVPPQVFIPPPDVGSAVIRIDRISPHPAAGRAESLAAAAFRMRRKMLRRSLEATLHDPVATLESAGIEPTARAEDLSASEYLRLAEVAGT
ncbi:MAG TPA: 16S rRNA (adenine(1518)-N(6)/adenine(1519)-N(6))-dimethyltransferase RsmA [Acidimicrobiia bacterium]|jgi:16S rRNA (adenine1518-N6/adenine1519-N6)-dimethyltransferase